MKFWSIIFGISLFLFACKNEKEEVVDFNSLSKPSGKDNFEDTSKVKNTVSKGLFYDSISSFSQQIIDSLEFDNNMVFKLDTLIYPDRFGALKAEKWYLKTAKDSLVFMRWDFKNNVMSKNTFYNWLDCYGAKCKSITIGSKVSFSKRATCFFLVDKTLFFIESAQKMDGERWTAVLSNIRENKKFDFFMLQQPRGKGVWNSIDDKGILKPIEILPN
jgi:hypothetical protein